MKTKPPLTTDNVLPWCNDLTRELQALLKDGGLKYPLVEKSSELQQLQHPKYIGRLAHVKEENNPYMGVRADKDNKTVWKKVTLEV